MNNLSEYAIKVSKIGKIYGVNHKGQFIRGYSVAEVVAKMCQMDKELELRQHEMRNTKY